MIDTERLSQDGKHPDDFVNGDDIHFQYSQTRPSQRGGNPSSVHATLNNPDEDYPTSRVIKQSPNGDVVVESIVEEMLASHAPAAAAAAAAVAAPQGSPSQHIGDVQASLWNNATLEEQESLKNFWDSLDDDHKIRLVKIDKKAIMDLFKSQARALHLDQLPLMPSQSTNHRHGHGHSSSTHHSNPYSSHRHPNPSTNDSSSNFPSKSLPQDSCTCKYCGRRSAVIEDELESIYDTHFDDILEFIHEIRDINDLNALPGLLFGGFHLLDAELKLQKKMASHLPQRPNPPVQAKPAAPQTPRPSSSSQPLHPTSKAIDSVHNEPFQQSANDIPSKPADYLSSRPLAEQKILQSELLKIARVCADVNDTPEDELYHKSSFAHRTGLEVKADPSESLSAPPPASGSEPPVDPTQLLLQRCEEKIFHKLLDPKLFQVLENMDIDKLKKLTSASGGQDSITLNTLLEKAGSLRDIIRDLHDADKMLIDKGVAFLQNMGHIFSANNALNNDPASAKHISEPMSANLASQLSHGLLTFAEDLLKNDGNSFISMMEALSESRNVRELHLKEVDNDNPAWVDEDDKDDIAASSSRGQDMPSYNEVYGNTAENPDLVHEVDEDYEHEYEDEDEDLDDEEEEEDHDELCDEHSVEEKFDEELSETESEISEEEKMQEIRRLFLIQVIKLFQARLKKAYQEKLSQDRTNLLIQELEAEENAKKERELKKLKQKEKLKEKKRLQQLAKEEERQKRQLELLAKQEADREKLEALRLDQKRRKEEQRLKREEEKKKRIEEIKRKEEEHQKKIEAQRKREEEAKKLKEDRKKRAEEERKRKEEEKKVKDALKLERDRERELQRLDRERGELSSHVQNALLARSPEAVLKSLANSPAKSSGPEPLALDNMLPSQLANTLAYDYEKSYPQYSNQVAPQIKSPAPHHHISAPVPSHPAPPISLSTKSPTMAHTQKVTPESLMYGPGLHQVHSKGPANSQPIQRGNSFANGLPWASQAVMANSNSVTHTPPGLFQTPFLANSFSPFHAPPQNEASDFYPQVPSGGVGGLILPQQDHLLAGATAPMVASNAPPHGGGWSQRKSSIWNQPNLGMANAQSQVGMLNTGHGTSSVMSPQLLWSLSPLNANHALPNTFLPNSSDYPLSTTPSIPASVAESATASTTGPGSGNLMGDTGHELLQKAAYTAFMHLQSLQQLDFGNAPLHKLYAIVPQLAGLVNVPLQQLLNALRAPSAYPFELVHDDFGTVTHVKMGYSRASLGHGSSILGGGAPIQSFGQSSPLLQRHPMLSTTAPAIMPMSGQMASTTTDDQVMTESLLRNFDQMHMDDDGLTPSNPSQRIAEPLLGTDHSTASYITNRGLWN